MASNDKHPVPPQPAEDFYGRPKAPREGGEPPREGQGSAPHADPKPRPTEEEDDERKPRRELTEADEKGIRPRTGDDDRDLRLRDASGLHPYDPRERAPGSSLDDMPDGDGPRSDAGTNPVSDVYRYGHPDRIPDRER
ncbi:MULTISPECIES: hypothetical protein [unclassified Corallococcus]|uniref:hypothetical protein n=1 Tax=unclassified Corallococcus TaxID=2685029 RepID=UPI001F5E0591|nr:MULTISPECIES: hypothetical protein [unclassified Corallococcus]WAS86864.1 hypothetical protein O0N60_07780 [Corallococcus sp. NCRR]